MKYCRKNNTLRVIHAVIWLYLFLLSAPGFAEFQSRMLNAHDQDILQSVTACANLQTPSNLSDAVYMIGAQVMSNEEHKARVGIGIMVKSITRISEVDNSFSLTGYLYLIWCDRALSKLVMIPKTKLLFLEASARRQIEKQWWPDVYFVNDTEKHMSENIELNIYGDGTVHYREKFNVELTANYDLHKFPFDTQVLTVDVESFSWDLDQLSFIVIPTMTGITEGVTVAEWRVDGVDADVTHDKEINDRSLFSEYQLEVYVSHKPGYFLLKVILPLILLVCVSWAVFWMKRLDIGFRLAPLLTVMLTVVAFNFTISSSLPKVNYLTYFDKLIIWSFITIFLAVIANLAISIYYQANNLEAAYKVNRMCKFIFPALYATGIAVMTILTLA